MRFGQSKEIEQEDGWKELFGVGTVRSSDGGDLFLCVENEMTSDRFEWAGLFEVFFSQTEAVRCLESSQS